MVTLDTEVHKENVESHLLTQILPSAQKVMGIHGHTEHIL